MTPSPSEKTSSISVAAAMYDPANLKEYPGIDLSRFGKTPFGKNLYRITFASSVVHQVAYQSTGGYAHDNAGTLFSTTGGSWRWEWRPKYWAIGDQWILEQWRSAWEFHGMGRSQWERDCPNLPFYPEGVYEQCHTFEACTPVDANLDKLIMWINEGRNRSPQAIADACRAEYDAETKATGDEIGARIRNCLPAFGSVAMSGRVSRGTKTGAMKRSAEDMQRRGFVVAHDEARDGELPVGVAKSKVVSGGSVDAQVGKPEGSWKVPVSL
jgi:hypothetical protein